MAHIRDLRDRGVELPKTGDRPQSRLHGVLEAEVIATAVPIRYRGQNRHTQTVRGFVNVTVWSRADIIFHALNRSAINDDLRLSKCGRSAQQADQECAKHKCWKKSP